MTNQKQRLQAVYGPLFSRKIVTLERPIAVACVVGAKGGGAEEEERVPPFFPSSLSPTPFDACYAWYLLEWWLYWFLLYRGVTQHFKKNLSKCFYFAAVVLFASCPLWDLRRYSSTLT